jgi:AcrR family transcriptional regulator
MAIRFPASDSAITVDLSSTIVYQLVEMNGSGEVGGSTRDRILAASLDLFGTRGVDAVSLDEIARTVGVRKQTVLYWFESKDALVDEVLAVAAAELVVVIDAALRAAPDDPLDRIDAVVRAVFRPAVRRPALLGLIREVSRLESAPAERLRARIQSLVDRAVGYLGAEMDAGRLRRGDPRLVAALGYATLTGIATEPEALRAVGWQPTAAGLRHLRDELRDFLRAALAPT